MTGTCSNTTVNTFQQQLRVVAQLLHSSNAAQYVSLHTAQRRVHAGVPTRSSNNKSGSDSQAGVNSSNSCSSSSVMLTLLVLASQWTSAHGVAATVKTV
eukprot:20732-Heterococcus_DN1.PRE.3